MKILIGWWTILLFSSAQVHAIWGAIFGCTSRLLMAWYLSMVFVPIHVLLFGFMWAIWYSVVGHLQFFHERALTKMNWNIFLPLWLVVPCSMHATPLRFETLFCKVVSMANCQLLVPLLSIDPWEWFIIFRFYSINSSRLYMYFSQAESGSASWRKGKQNNNSNNNGITHNVESTLHERIISTRLGRGRRIILSKWLYRGYLPLKSVEDRTRFSPWRCR